MLIRVLVTGVGGPGIIGTFYSLKNNNEHNKIKIIGSDMNPDAIGKFFCDRFYKIYPAHHPKFLTRVLKICKREKVDVILPQVTRELYSLSKNREIFEKYDIKISVSNHNAIIKANNKYSLMKISEKINIPHPNYKLITTWDELKKCPELLGIPFIIKPPISDGMRGFRIIDNKIKDKISFYKSKPDNRYSNLSAIHRILGDKFPPLLATEYLPGPEYTIDVLSKKKLIYYIIPRLREQIKDGITFKGRLHYKRDLINYVKKLTHELDLEYAHGYQFKADKDNQLKLIESNPRIQGTMIMSTLANANIIYDTVLLAMNKAITIQKINWNVIFYRYWGGISVNGGIIQI